MLFSYVIDLSSVVLWPLQLVLFITGCLLPAVVRPEMVVEIITVPMSLIREGRWRFREFCCLTQ